MAMTSFLDWLTFVLARARITLSPRTPPLVLAADVPDLTMTEGKMGSCPIGPLRGCPNSAMATHPVLEKIP